MFRLLDLKMFSKLSVAEHDFNPGTGEAEAEGLQVSNHDGLQNKTLSQKEKHSMKTEFKETI